MSVVKGKAKLSALLMASLITANFVCASDTYKNNIVDVKVNGESGNAVKVTIYTDRPYTDPVVVNKKANNKYVILMPETNSSLKASPTVTNASGTVSNVSVNTQNVTGGKGYTKIIITSEKTINVVPRTLQVTSKTAQKPSTTTTVLKTDSPVNTKAIATKQTTVKKAAQKPAQKKVTKPTVQQKPVATSQVATPPVAVTPAKKAPIEVLEQEIRTGQYANVVKDTSDEILNQEIKGNLDNENETKETVVETTTDKGAVIDNIKSAIKSHQRLSLWKLILLAGAITFPLIVIMIILSMDKKINKKIDKTFRKEEEENNIAYTETEQAPVYEEAPIYSSSENNQTESECIEPELINEDLSEEPTLDETSPEVQQEELINDVFSQTTDEFNNDYEDTDFEHDFEQSEITQETDTTNIIDTDSTELTTVNEEGPVELEPFNPDGYLADFSGVDDKEFIDELTLQTMAANNADGLPEESPADSIFNFMDDTSGEKVSSAVNSSTETGINEDNSEQTASNEESNDDLKMLTEVKLDDSAGLYLVNYENFSSLVGHIRDNYFVIKKFDDIVNGKVILKQAEKLKDSTRYLVRVGKNKMVVEVTDNSMTKLLDL